MTARRGVTAPIRRPWPGPDRAVGGDRAARHPRVRAERRRPRHRAPRAGLAPWRPQTHQL